VVAGGSGFSGLGAEDPQQSGSGNRRYPVQLSSRLSVSSQAELGGRIDAAFAEGTAHPARVNNCSDLLAKGRETLLANATGPDAPKLRRAI
jgi:hypothetical protein